MEKLGFENASPLRESRPEEVWWLFWKEKRPCLFYCFIFSLAVKSRPGEQGECNCTAEPLFLAHLSCVRIVMSPSLFDALFRRGEENGDKRFRSIVLFRHDEGDGHHKTFSSGWYRQTFIINFLIII